MVEPEGHMVEYTYMGPCSSEDDNTHQTGLTNEPQAVLSGLEAFSEYHVTVITIYPSTRISADTVITTLPQGELCIRI